MGRKAKATNDQSLKGRLTRILSAKMDEFNEGTQKQLLYEWGLAEWKTWAEHAASLANAGITRYLGVPQTAKM